MEYIAIHTNQTSYVMAVLPSGHLEHVHYGQKIQIFEEKGLVESSAFIPNHHSGFCQEELFYYRKYFKV